MVLKYIEILKELELEKKSKPKIQELAAEEGFFGTSIGCQSGDFDFNKKECTKKMRKDEVLDSVKKHRLLQEQMDNIDTKDKLIKFAKEKGYDVNKLGKYPTMADVRDFINAGGYTKKDTEDYRARVEEIKLTHEENLKLKLERIEKMGEVLPSIRKKYKENMKRPKVDLDKVNAVITGLIDEAQFRIGNETSPVKYGTYGVSTLKPEYVEIDEKNKTLEFIYLGKKGEEQKKKIEDPELFKAFMDIYNYQKRDPCVSNREKRLFCYDERGVSTPVKNSDVRKYLEPFGVTPHTFRHYYANKYLKDFLDLGKTYEETLMFIAERLGHFRTKKGVRFPDGKTAERSYVIPELVDKYSKGRTGKNPVYHKAKDIIEDESGLDTKSWGRVKILDYLKENPGSEAWKVM